MGAFSLNWPYISFAGHDNLLVIANAYEGTFLHRIQVTESDKTLKICQTYLSDSKDLFILIHVSEKYRLYKIDLDESNIRELDDDAYS